MGLELVVIAIALTLPALLSARHMARYNYFFRRARERREARRAQRMEQQASGSGAKSVPLLGAAPGLADLWPLPTLVFAALLVTWGAEIAEFIVSQGLALAILAWLQVMPEFTVEAAIAWSGNLHLITANFTGSNRLLIGLGWPLVMYTAFYYARKKGTPFREVIIPEAHSIEVIFLGIPTLFFFVILATNTLWILESLILAAMFVIYLWILGRLPRTAEGAIEDKRGVPLQVLKRTMANPRRRVVAVVLLFGVGGSILLLSAGPFVHTLQAIALAAGLSQFLFIQWLAPALSEAPEGVSIFYWAKSVKFASLGFVNVLSAKINQWTVLIAMIPVVFMAGRGTVFAPIHFDEFQQTEILLTVAQSVFAFSLILNMKLKMGEVHLIFVLWLAQLIAGIPAVNMPASGALGLPYSLDPDATSVGDFQHVFKVIESYVYFALAGVSVVLQRKEIKALAAFRKTMREQVLISKQERASRRDGGKSPQA